MTNNLIKSNNNIVFYLFICIIFFLYLLPKIQCKNNVEDFIGANTHKEDNYYFEAKTECCNFLTVPPFFKINNNNYPSSYTASNGCVCLNKRDHDMLIKRGSNHNYDENLIYNSTLPHTSDGY